VVLIEETSHVFRNGEYTDPGSRFVNKDNSRRWCCDTHGIRRDLSCQIVL